MKEISQKEGFDSKITPSDWRYSAAIVGLMRFFARFDLDYCIDYEAKEVDGDFEDVEYLYYNNKDITCVEAKENYLLYVEECFSDNMHHLQIEDILNSGELTEEKCKFVNEKLAGNSICKKVFSKIKCSDESKSEILDLISENRLELISETYRNSPAMYKKFANENKLFSEDSKVCRLWNYYTDLPKKSKAMAYNWDYNTFVSNDVTEFDFIPFGFTKTRDSFFINSNYDIESLFNQNNILKDKINMCSEDSQYFRNMKYYFFETMRNTSTFIKYDIEVIHKSQDDEYYKTMCIRHKSIEIINSISKRKYRMMGVPFRLADKTYFSGAEVMNRIINMVYIDDIIENLLKLNSEKSMLIDILIGINQSIYGGEKMKEKIYAAKKTAQNIRAVIAGMSNGNNKVKSYQQKMISAIIFKDYDRFCEILMQLTAYVSLPLEFAYDLLIDFEKNKNIAYAFVLGLTDSQRDSKEENTEGAEDTAEVEKENN